MMNLFLKNKKLEPNLTNNKPTFRYDETQVPIEVRTELKLKNEVAMLKRELAVKI